MGGKPRFTTPRPYIEEPSWLSTLTGIPKKMPDCACTAVTLVSSSVPARGETETMDGESLFTAPHP